MKATKLIEILQKDIKKYGENIEVFVEFPGMNYEDIHSTRDDTGIMVHVENLSDYPENLIMEHHGENDGLIYGVVILGDRLVDHCG
jgi:hypothetical protein